MAKKPGSRRATPQPERRTALPPSTRILLATAAGGRCEFAGCNQFLFAHPLTLRDGNFSEHAHIYSFSRKGPRGRAKGRPKEIDSISNLMLLCASCHKQIDDLPGDFPVSALRQQKLAHEERIHHVTGLGPEMRTTVVQLKAKIGGDAVDIPLTDVVAAVAPRYPSDTKGHVIDLTGFSMDSDGFVQAATDQIEREVGALYRPGMDASKTRHISLFALGPIHLLVTLGRHLSNKIPVDLFQRHRDGQAPWAWKTTGTPSRFARRVVRAVPNASRVAMLLPLSGPIDPSKLPPAIDGTFAVYAIELVGRGPGVDFLRQRSDLDAFRECYRALLAEMREANPSLAEVHLFPAVPAPIAVACGHDLLPKVDPALHVYDFNKNRGGFSLRCIVNVTSPK